MTAYSGKENDFFCAVFLNRYNKSWGIIYDLLQGGKESCVVKGF